ncbi:MAG: hypothetical protein FJ272_17350, partial [Planctomycetes bacterium]|nr:hypothetical protein [Planctomycetota bacterium]
MERAFWLPVVLAIWSALAYAQTENPVTNGSFERLDAKGFPVDWMAVGGPPTSEIGASNDAHSGQRSLRLKRVTDTPKVETGLNRAWTQDTGQQGAMLSVLKGGITFWYKAPSAQNAKLNFYVIPMSEKPKEDTGEPRAFYTVPADHVGDGQWHKGAVKYDFSKAAKAKWIHVAPRIVGGTAEWLIDDISHVEKVGPIVRAMGLRLTETPGKLGESCELTLPVENFGDAPAADVRAELLLPAYLKPADGQSAKTIKNLAPEARATFSWQVAGLRDKADAIRAKVTCNEIVSGSALALKPDLKVVALVPEGFVLSRREKVKLHCVLENRGNAAATGVTAKLTLPPDMPIVGKVDVAAVSVKPTEQKEIEWTIEARVESIRLNAWVEVKAANCEGGEAQTRFIVGGLSAPSPSGVSQRAVAVSQRDLAMLENHRLRLLFGHNTFGFGTAELFVRMENAWVGVAKLAALSRLVYETADGKRVERPIYGDPVAVGRTGDVASLKFTR